MDVLHQRCCGLDVHKSSISACILLHVSGRVQKHQRRFGAMTQDLHELAHWLKEFEVTQVAMESSGVYWKPVWNILEGQFTVVLVNAQHIKNVPGRKTDQKDAEWIAQLLQHGLLRPSYVPCEMIRDLRDLTRMRVSLSQEASRISSRVQKVLVLLCHKKGAPQKGQLESCRSRTRAMVCRSVAMDQGLCRSTRTGRAPRAELGRHFGDG